MKMQNAARYGRTVFAKQVDMNGPAIRISVVRVWPGYAGDFFMRYDMHNLLAPWIRLDTHKVRVIATACLTQNGWMVAPFRVTGGQMWYGDHGSSGPARALASLHGWRARRDA
jgi:hypothetical protein